MSTEESIRARDKRWSRPRELVDGRWVSTCNVTHGLYTTYSNYLCRCPECTEAHRLKLKMVRAERRTELILVEGRWTHPRVTKHGASAYTNYGCRCEKCTKDFNANTRWYTQNREARNRAKKTG